MGSDRPASIAATRNKSAREDPRAKSGPGDERFGRRVRRRAVWARWRIPRACTKLYRALGHWLSEELPFKEPYYSNLEIPAV
jgi:hypothetical protein